MTVQTSIKVYELAPGAVVSPGDMVVITEGKIDKAVPAVKTPSIEIEDKKGV